MIYSKTCEYAVRALSYLASKPLHTPTNISEVSEETGLPGPYISKIFRSLTKAGVLKSVRGVAGGFSLNKRPQEISLMDVVSAIDAMTPWKRCAMGLDECRDDNACPAHEIWKRTMFKMVEKFEKTRLSSLTKKIEKFRYRELERSRLNVLMKI